ncbi:MAG: ice-binding family protein [Umezawaea sp.]
MTTFRSTRSPERITGKPRKAAISLVVLLTSALIGVAGPPSSSAATATIGLGSAGDFAVLAGSTITNTGATTVDGDLGLSPGTAVTGFPPGVVTGAVHAADAVGGQAKADLDTAYDDASARPTSATVPVELGGTTRGPGVYESPAGTFGITGTLVLDAAGDPDAVFLFKAASTLITAATSSVQLVNGAQADNVFWRVGSSATLGAGSTLRGTVMALASITVGAGTTVDGRVLARTAAVTLDSSTITRPAAAVTGPTSTTTTLATSANPVQSGRPVTLSAEVVGANGAVVTTGYVVFVDRWDTIEVVAVDATGHAAHTTSTLTAGLHFVTAVYVGEGGFLDSTSPRIHVLVLK